MCVDPPFEGCQKVDCVFDPPAPLKGAKGYTVISIVGDPPHPTHPPCGGNQKVDTVSNSELCVGWGQCTVQRWVGLVGC